MNHKLTADQLLNLLIAALLVGIVAFGGFGYYAYTQSEQRVAAVLQAGRDLGAAAATARAADALAQAQAIEFDRLLAARSSDGTGPAPRLELLNKQEESVRKNLEEAAAALARHDLDASRLEEAGRLQARLQQHHERRLKQPAAGEQGATAAEPWIEVAPGVNTLVQQHTARVAEESAVQTRGVAMLMAFLVVLGIGIALAFRYRIRRANGRPLKAATQLVEQIAAGDLTVRADGMEQAHTYRLARALDEMTASLRTLATEVVRSAQTVADTSAQIAQGNLDLSQRTEEQATTLEETASSMEELTSTVAQNADNARQASQLAIAASDVARKGGQVVGQVVATMTDISASSRRIGDIIGVIDGIAFQTNILALNAAVEAARAGEQGRGFAVVAAEVRNLAQRSAAAAKEIKSLIGDSLGKVDAGTKLVDAAGKTMDEIVGSVKKVSDLIAEIAAASQEQSAGIGQINTAVAQMEQVVQQNASLVEEASAATESMKDQAAALLGTVSRFRLGDAPMAALQRQGVLRRSAAAIKVRPAAGLPSAYPAAIGAAPAQPRAQSGQWEEF